MAPALDHDLWPDFLDLQGFYQSPFNKTLGKSFVQIVRTMFYLAILVSCCVIFSVCR